MTTERKPSGPRWINWARLFALLLVVGISIYIFFIPEEQMQGLEAYGYPGIFLLSIIANATVLIPAPGILFVFILGAKLPPLWVGIAAGLGATIGEFSGYLAGFSGQAVIENQDLYNKFVGWMEKYGGVTIMVLGFIPNPFFDLAGIAAGALKMPVWKFILWVSIGKILKMLMIAYAGAGLFSLPFLTP